MSKLSTAKRTAVIAALVEGNSIRATSRMTDVSEPTVLNLLADLGRVCAAYHDEFVTDLQTERVQCDEIWSFCYAKAKNVPERTRYPVGAAGDVWTGTAIDADTKLMISYYVGDRSTHAADCFMTDLAYRVRRNIQLTTDGHKPYMSAVAFAFEGRRIDYAMLQKGLPQR